MYTRRAGLIILTLILAISLAGLSGVANSRVAVIMLGQDLASAIKAGGLMGSVEINIVSPGGIHSVEVGLDQLLRGPVSVSLDEAYREWESSGWVDRGMMPTIVIVFYLHEGGSEYIFSHRYTALEYYLDRGLRPVEALEAAAANPLAVFDNPTILLDGRHGLLDKLEAGRVEVPEPGASGAGQPGASGCSDTYTKVYYEELWDSRYSPPEGWMSRVVGVSDEYKAALWRVFASKYSKAYYFSASKYSYGDVYGYAVSTFRGGEGIVTMRQLLYRLGANTADWIPSRAPYERVGMDVPYIGVAAKFYSGGGSLVFIAEALRTNYTVSVRGFTFMGVTLYGVSSIPAFEGDMTALYSDGKRYVMVPVEYTFIDDGLLQVFDIDEVYDPACGPYWRLLVIHSFTPFYVMTREDLANAYTYAASLQDPDPPALEQLAYETGYTTLMDSSVYAGIGETVFKEMNADPSLDGSYGALVYNVYKPWLDSAVEAVAEGRPLLSALYKGLSSLYFGYSHVNIGGTAVLLQFQAEAYTGLEGVHVRIYKETPPLYHEYYTIAGYRPHVSRYVVIVS